MSSYCMLIMDIKHAKCTSIEESALLFKPEHSESLTSSVDVLGHIVAKVLYSTFYIR